jgi:hypothetical protein
MLEAGIMDEDGEWIADKNLLLGFEAYRERVRMNRQERSVTSAGQVAKSQISSWIAKDPG